MARRLEDQIRMMEEMLQLQSKIRNRKEKERILKTDQSGKYTKIFEPVTKTIEKLVQLKHPVQQQPIQRVEEEEDLINLKDVEKEEAPDEEEYKEPSIYHDVLQSIPPRYRDDGVFGLNAQNHSIGDYQYRVVGNRLEVYNDGVRRQYEINDIHLWQLLLAQTANGINLKTKTGGRYLPFVKDYKRIADDLDLVAYAFENFDRLSIRRRSKYKLITSVLGEKKGSGFLFSVKPPPFVNNKKKRIKPSTVVIPSDKKGLLRELYKAVAELRAGNRSMQNLVVPLAQEAKRKRILPRNLLTADEKTWVFV